MEVEESQSIEIGSSVWDTYERVLRKHGPLPLLGTLQHHLDEKTRSLILDGFVWISYAEFLVRVEAFSSALIDRFAFGACIGICCSNRVEWLIADLACVRAGLTSIPIHTNYATDETFISCIVTKTALQAVVCEQESVKCFLAWNIPSLIVVSEPPESELEFKMASRILRFSSLERLGLENPRNPRVMTREMATTIFYSSGSTGMPKGMQMTESALLAELEDALECGPDELPHHLDHSIHLIIYSLATSLERDNFQSVVMFGGKLGLFNLPMGYVWAALDLIQPTIILGVPALWTSYYQLFQSTLESRLAENAKEKETYRSFLTKLGPNLMTISSGTAPLPENVKRFLFDVFGSKRFIGEGYGTQETGLITLENKIQEDVTVGLRDLPDQGYTKNDKPFPRGEICVKTNAMVTEYYNNSEQKVVSLISDGPLTGYFATGDIGEFRTVPIYLDYRKSVGSKKRKTCSHAKPKKIGEEKLLFVIGRIKHVFKSSNGEWLCPLRLEGLFLQHVSLVHQIFITGYPSMTPIRLCSLWNSVAAVVVPNLALLKERLGSMNLVYAMETILDKCCQQDPVISSLFLEELTYYANRLDLRPHEHINHILLDCPIDSNASAGTSTSSIESSEAKGIVGTTENAKKKNDIEMDVDNMAIISDDAKRNGFEASNKISSASTGLLNDDSLLLIANVGWSSANGFLTPALKMNRPRLTRHYTPILEKHAREMSQNRRESFEQLFPARLYKDDDLVCELPALDSLHIYQISQKLRFSIDLLLSPLTTIGHLSRILERGEIEDIQAMERNLAQMEVEQIREDRKLIDGLEANGKCEKRTQFEPTTRDSETKCDGDSIGKKDRLKVLLTGATGFVGSEILLELLKLDFACVCLVRGSTTNEAKSRLRNELGEDAISLYDKDNRILIALGDLENLNFGNESESNMTVETNTHEADEFSLKTQSHEIACIVHCAAIVDWMKPYSSVRDANVLATFELLKLSLKWNIPILYVSSGSAHNLLDDPFSIQSAGGYAASKRVAEILIERASAKFGLKSSILRIGNVSANSKTFHLNRKDFISRYLKTCIDLRMCVESKSQLEMIPVDRVATLIGHIVSRMTNRIAANSPTLACGYNLRKKRAASNTNNSNLRASQCTDDELDALIVVKPDALPLSLSNPNSLSYSELAMKIVKWDSAKLRRSPTLADSNFVPISGFALVSPKKFLETIQRCDREWKETEDAVNNENSQSNLRDQSCPLAPLLSILLGNPFWGVNSLSSSRFAHILEEEREVQHEEDEQDLNEPIELDTRVAQLEESIASSNGSAEQYNNWRHLTQNYVSGFLNEINR